MRRTSIGTAAVLAATLAAAPAFWLGCGSRGRDSDRGPKNVILVTLDTTRPDHLGCYGHSAIRTPQIDRLARSSARFEEAVTVVPTTLASHLSILTGTTPRTHGVGRNGFRAGDANLTLAEILKAEGYQTAAFVSAFSLDPRFNLTQGFDVYDCTYDERITPELADQAQRRAGPVTDAVLRWLGNRSEGPFFLWVHYFDPHFPYDPPGAYATLYDPDYRGPADGSMDYLEQVWEKRCSPSPRDRRHMISLYDGEISYMDEQLGRLLDALERSKLLDASILIVVADHGESLGEHGYDFDHGQFVYDPSIRVPLLIRVPGPRGGRVIPGQVETIDLMPTVLDILGLPIPPVVEGRSLRPLLEGDRGWTSRTAFCEASKPWDVEPDSASVFQNAWKAKCARTEEWKFIYTPFARTRELYNLSEDPGEETNRLTSDVERALELQNELQGWAERPRQRIETEDLTPDPETLERLRALGYVQD